MAYRSDSFETVKALYEAEGETVSSQLQKAVIDFEARTRFPRTVYVRDTVSAALVKAAGLLRLYPGRKLATAPVKLDDRIQSDLQLSTLVEVINASVDPSTNSHDFRPFSSPKVGSVDACKKAEVNFAYTFTQLQQWADGENRIDYGAQVIAADGTPVMIRKSLVAYSTLSLVGLSVNGIPYPAGSVFRVELDDGGDEVPIRGIGQPVPAGKITAHDVSEVSKIGFRRLSAYAFQPDQRAHFYIPGEHVMPENAELIQDFRITQIRGLAKRALAMCQVA